MPHNEPWQIFSPNGEAIPANSITPSESRKTSQIIVGAVHVWIWQQAHGEIEILLQRRAKNKPTWPDSLDISVAGHIDAGESTLQAVSREGKEEIGAMLDVKKLEYIFSYRNFENGIKWVYLYEETQPQEYSFNDGEVQSLEWVKLSDFADMVKNPEAHTLVPHPAEYFGLLIKALRHAGEDRQELQLTGRISK